MKVLSFLFGAALNIAASMAVAFVLLGLINLTFGAPLPTDLDCPWGLLIRMDRVEEVENAQQQ